MQQELISNCHIRAIVEKAGRVFCLIHLNKSILKYNLYLIVGICNKYFYI